MKTSKFLAAVIVLLVTTGSIFAQSSNSEAAVKILPSENGMVKLMYMGNTESAVNVKFLSGDKVITRDKIKAFEFENGFVKYYDISKIWKQDLTIKVVADDLEYSQRFDTKSNYPLWAQFYNNETNNNTSIASLTSSDKGILNK